MPENARRQMLRARMLAKGHTTEQVDALFLAFDTAMTDGYAPSVAALRDLRDRMNGSGPAAEGENKTAQEGPQSS